MCLGVGLFVSILFWTLCASWTYMSISFARLGKFSIIFSNRFTISCSFSFPLASLWCKYWNTWSCPRGSLAYPCFLDSFFLLLVLIGCFCFLMFQNADLIFQLHLLYSCFPVNCTSFHSVSFISDWIIFMLLRSSLSSLSTLITSVLNSASDRLLISILFSSFSVVLICSFTWSMFLCLLILAAFLRLFLCIM